MLAEQDNWMNPLNRLIWIKAFRQRKTRVTIRDGRKFKLDYDVPPFVIKTLGEEVEVVHVYMAPMDEQPSWVETCFAPYGFFDLKEVTNFHWIAAGNKKPRNTILNSVG
jgi:hypothetical protein